MQEEGTVVKTESKKASVKIVRHSACSKCEKKCGLSESHEQDELVVEIDNKVGAEKGQKVILEMQEKNIVFAALFVYILPLLLMITGYYVGNWFALKWQLQTGEIAGITGTLIFLGLSFLLIKIINPLLEKKSGFHPVIKRLL